MKDGEYIADDFFADLYELAEELKEIENQKTHERGGSVGSHAST